MDPDVDAEAKNEKATSFPARRSRASTASESLSPSSAVGRQMRIEPEALSTKLSIP
jgi:hypothetical protein